MQASMTSQRLASQRPVAGTTCAMVQPSTRRFAPFQSALTSRGLGSSSAVASTAALRRCCSVAAPATRVAAGAASVQAEISYIMIKPDGAWGCCFYLISGLQDVKGLG